jgi:hypothetical protein
MALEEAAAWLDGDLVLPIGGKTYKVPEPSAELGMRLEIILNVGRGVEGGPRTAGKMTDRQRQVLSDEEERDTYRDVLGPAYDAMVKDGVTWPRLKHAAITAMFHFLISPAVAEQHWNGGAGKATGRSSRPATRRTTAAASTTKSRASGSGTRSRRSS